MFQVVRSARWRPPCTARWLPGPDLVGGSASGVMGPSHVVLMARDAAAAIEMVARGADVVLDADGGHQILLNNARFSILPDGDDLLLVLDRADRVETLRAPRRRPVRRGRTARPRAR